MYWTMNLDGVYEKVPGCSVMCNTTVKVSYLPCELIILGYDTTNFHLPHSLGDR